MVIEFLCLANSSKRGKRCIAGLRTDGGGWVRLVSRVGNGGLSDVECAYTDRNLPSVLDVICAGVAEHRPQPHQPENWIIAGRPWERVRSTELANERDLIAPFISSEPTLFGSCKTKTPYNDLLLRPKTESLTLVLPADVSWRWERGSDGWKLRVFFVCNGASYDLPVTDDRFEESLTAVCEPPHAPMWRLNHDVDWLFLISLSEPFDAAGGDHPLCYTLVASVMSAPKSWLDSSAACRS